MLRTKKYLYDVLEKLERLAARVAPLVLRFRRGRTVTSRRLATIDRWRIEATFRRAIVAFNERPSRTRVAAAG